MILGLVRHGFSEANQKCLVTGKPNDELTRLGIKQAQMLKRWIFKTDFNPSKFVSSHWRRAQQTAQVLAPDKDWEIDRRVGETNAGNVADWPLIDFNNRYPDLMSDYRNAYPGGESHAQLNQRVLDWLYETVRDSEPKDKVLLVAHSGPITCILQHLVGIGMDRFPAFVPTHASLSVAEVMFDGKSTYGCLLAFALCSDRDITESLKTELY